MSFPNMTDDMDIIAALGDEPNEDDGLTAAGLKAKFDMAGNLCKTALNNLVNALHAITAAGNIGFQSSENVPADNVQDAIDNVQAQIRDVSQDGVANNSITAEKLAAGAAGFTDVTNQLTFTARNSNPPTVTNNLKFRYSAALGMMFITGKISLHKTASGFYEIRYSITGPFTFGTDNCSKIQFSASIGEPTGFLDCAGSSLTMEVDFGAVDDSDLVLDTVFTNVSAWVFCSPVSNG